MPQTLLALLALALASLLTFNQQRLTVRTQTNMITDEIELAAAGLASEITEFIGARSFDEASTPEKIFLAGGKVPDDPNDFTKGSAFGDMTLGTDGCHFTKPVLTPKCDDVDDVHGIGWTPVDVTLAHGRKLGFEVRTRAFYVDSTSSMTPATSRTLHKRVVMDIRSDHVPGDELEGLLRVTRVISYDPLKAKADYEDDATWGPHGKIGSILTGGATP